MYMVFLYIFCVWVSSYWIVLLVPHAVMIYIVSSKVTQGHKLSILLTVGIRLSISSLYAAVTCLHDVLSVREYRPTWSPVTLCNPSDRVELINLYLMLDFSIVVISFLQCSRCATRCQLPRFSFFGDFHTSLQLFIVNLAFVV